MEVLRRVRESNRQINTLREYVKKLKYLNSLKENSVLPEEEEISLFAQIQALNDLFKNLSDQVKEFLKKVYLFLEQSDDKDSSTYNAVKEQWTTLTHNLTQVVSDFRYVQVEHNNKEREMLRDQYLIARPDASDKELNELMTADNAADVLRNAFMSDNTQDLVYRQAQKRLEDIKVIVDYIDQLCQLLRDIDQMVAGQADFVDRIEIDVVTSRENTQNMNENLRKTLKNTRRWKIVKRILFLIIGIVLVIIIVYVFNSVIKPIFFSKSK